MPIFPRRKNSVSALLWLASVAVVLAGAALLVGAREPLNQSVARLDSGEVPQLRSPQLNAQRSTIANSGMTRQAAVEREASTTERLHQLAESDPAAALRLAIADNLRFPGSTDAPERGWIICRSLVNLRRFAEAVSAARLLVEQYPDTPWALDAERHLLVNPMSDPSERGYGHQSELE